MEHLPQIEEDGVIFDNLTIIPGHSEPAVRNGAICISGDTILDLGSSSDIRKKHHDKSVVDMAGYLACPGFVNAHTHAAMSFFRDLGHDNVKGTNPGNSMIEDFFFPSEAKLTEELISPLSYSYLVDGLRSGVTFFGDAYFFARATCRAIEKIGLRGAVGEHHADLGGPLPAGQELWKKTKKWIDSWEFSNITPVVYAHAADTVSPSFLKELSDYSSANKLPFHMHLSQTSGEWDRVHSREKKSPVSVAHEAGALKENALLVHLLSIDEHDLKLIADSGAIAGLCPISEIIYERAPKARELMDANIPIALGTDCAASNDGADVHNEAKFLSLLLRMQGQAPESLNSEFLLETITRNGARALGAPFVGELTPGKKADLVFLRSAIDSQPVSKPYVNLMYSMGSRHVEHVLVDGKWALFNRNLVQVSEQDLKEEYEQAIREIQRRTQLPIDIGARNAL